MKHLFEIFKTGRQLNRVSTSLLNYVPQRGRRYEAQITWKEPEKYKHYHPIRSGDGSGLVIKDPLEIHYEYKNSKELEKADDKVKKVFSVGYLRPTEAFIHFKHELLEKIKEHPFDNSTSVRIAKATIFIRYLQNLLKYKPFKRRILRIFAFITINKRKSLLNKLRKEDYKKYEWLLEELNLVHKLTPLPSTKKLDRRGALLQLAQLKAEKIKEEKLAALKQKFDEEKVPFLEAKIEKLKQIIEMEKKVGLEPSVTEKDVEECVEKLENVKIQIQENAKIGYKRKIHPYFLEPYNESLLKEKEKAGQIIREQLEAKQQNQTSDVNAS